MIFRGRNGRLSALVAGIAALAALLLTLLLPRDALLCASNTDMTGEFVAWRAFLADSLRHGHIPLWNPFTYGGQPFLGGFESAVLYPPSLLFLVLPLGPALNFSLLLHLVLLGWGMERWASQRGFHPAAAGVAGVVLPLSGAVFPHLYAGHLSNLCTMAWAPWIFLGLESWTREGNRRGLFLAGAAICLQLLAGHVQYFFYTAVAAGLQALVLTAAAPELRRRALPAVIACYAAGLLLGAAQLLPGLATAAEGIRHRKLDYSFAAMFSFPPENFLTILAPGFFGNLGAPIYWGRCFLWEMTLFLGTVAPVLIAVALAGRDRRRAVLDLIVAGVLIVLALGVHTPFFHLLYYAAPGFGHFRSWSKFIFPATLFLVLVVTAGMDLLLRGKNVPRGIGWASVGAGFVAGTAALVLLFFPETIAGLLDIVRRSRESYVPPEAYSMHDFISQTGLHAGLSLGLAGLILVAAGTILLSLPGNPRLRWALPGLLLAEMIGFVAGQIVVAHFSDAMPTPLQQFVAAHPGDYRVVDFAHPNNGFLLGAGDLSGDNPSGLRRYAEFVNFIEGDNPDRATQYLPFHSASPLFALVRLRYVFVPLTEGARVVESATPPLPRLLLVSDAKVLANRTALFSALKDPAFHPDQTALLESEPDPRPVAGAVGTVRLLSDRSDEMTIEAQTDQPALLLVTDLYDHKWRAEAFPDSVQKEYHVLPADYILRGIPLAAGHHHLRLVYAPASWPLGLAISLAAWMLFGLALWREGACVSRDNKNKDSRDKK